MRAGKQNRPLPKSVKCGGFAERLCSRSVARRWRGSNPQLRTLAPCVIHYTTTSLTVLALSHIKAIPPLSPHEAVRAQRFRLSGSRESNPDNGYSYYSPLALMLRCVPCATSRYNRECPLTHLKRACRSQVRSVYHAYRFGVNVFAFAACTYRRRYRFRARSRPTCAGEAGRCSREFRRR